ncbi:Flp pilus assembly protein CpaB [Azoarcus sp. L1K30]|uniref:Flp pilus assembly protein CpaB n=1 Tax=Azoarcus sp. L1K30 TaxID=2820277 RepID=UPI001B81A917|nr:Flp pilus assembly protein CpaB [Azoarcus sp. L1K30]MBR0567419.1 Flp pilus assembly protein CpaB [Azoarcus sp. L1K30]
MKLQDLSKLRHNRTWLVLMAALVIGGLAAYAAQSYLARRMAEIEARSRGDTIGVVVAKRALKQGERISEETVAIRSVPVDFAHSQAILPENFDRVSGQTLAYPLKSGEMVLWGLLEGRKAPTFSSRVAEGRRAITVPVDEINSISGLLEPGDVVDLVLTLEQGGKKYSFVMQQKVPVLATGQRSTEDPRNGERRQYSTVTLDTTPDQARNIIRAREEGKLTALLRNPADEDERDGGELAANFLRDMTGELAQVPVLYGGRDGRLPPEGLHLGHYASPADLAQPTSSDRLISDALISASDRPAAPVLRAPQVR